MSTLTEAVCVAQCTCVDLPILRARISLTPYAAVQIQRVVLVCPLCGKEWVWYKTSPNQQLVKLG